MLTFAKEPPGVYHGLAFIRSSLKVSRVMLLVSITPCGCHPLIPLQTPGRLRAEHFLEMCGLRSAKRAADERALKMGAEVR